MLFLLNRQLSQHERVQKIRKGNAKNFHSSVANSETDCEEILNRGFSKIIDKTTFSKNFITFYIRDLNKVIWKKKKMPDIKNRMILKSICILIFTYMNDKILPCWYSKKDIIYKICLGEDVCTFILIFLAMLFVFFIFLVIII